jgi:hypothetical protein
VFAFLNKYLWDIYFFASINILSLTNHLNINILLLFQLVNNFIKYMQTLHPFDENVFHILNGCYLLLLYFSIIMLLLSILMLHVLTRTDPQQYSSTIDKAHWCLHAETKIFHTDATWKWQLCNVRLTPYGAYLQTFHTLFSYI